MRFQRIAPAMRSGGRRRRSARRRSLDDPAPLEPGEHPRALFAQRRLGRAMRGQPDERRRGHREQVERDAVCRRRTAARLGAVRDDRPWRLPQRLLEAAVRHCDQRRPARRAKLAADQSSRGPALACIAILSASSPAMGLPSATQRVDKGA
jgi:hypothetical protein